MPTYNSIKELTRGLQQGAKLLNDMFIKRKTVSVKYDDAVETLDGEENRLKHLINFGVIIQSGDTLELDDAYQRFFEEVLAVNEDINVASVQTYISKLKLGIESFLAADTPTRKAQYIREIRHTFKSIEMFIFVFCPSHLFCLFPYLYFITIIIIRIMAIITGYTMGTLFYSHYSLSFKLLRTTLPILLDTNFSIICSTFSSICIFKSIS